MSKKLKARKLKNQANKFDSKISVKIGLIVIMLLTVIAFSPVFTAEFTNWDDQGYVTENPVIQSLNAENLKLIFTENFVANYHPLTMLSLALDYAVAGESATWFHSVNLLLHLLNTLLVFYFVLLLFKKQQLPYFKDMALLVAALFGIHTLHVESVAWVAERKDVLYSFFFLLSLIAYVKYADTSKLKFYLLALVLFMLSLFSKGQAITLAVVLVPLDYLLNRKILSAKVLLEKLPFLALAIAFGIIALRAQQNDNALAATIQDEVSFFERMLFASYGYVQYHMKLIMPINLSAIYPYPPKIDGSFGMKFYGYFLAAILLIASMFYLARKNKLAAFGILFFMATIAVVIQIIPVGSAIMADRYAYLPSIGFFILLVTGMHWLITKRGMAYTSLASISIIYLLLLSGLSYNRAQVWENSMTLWNDVLAKNENVEIALNNRGSLLYKSGKYQQALNDFTKAIEISPDRAETYNNRGGVLNDLKDYKGALRDYSKALALDASYEKAYYGMGGVYLSQNQFEKAIDQYDQAINLNPTYAAAYSNRANAKINLSRVQEAMADFDEALRINPNYVEAYSNRGIARVVLGDFNGAIKDYSFALSLKSDDALTYYLRALAYEMIGKKQEACNDLSRSVSLGFQAARQKQAEICR